MEQKILITGGAGFIGCNAALHFYKKGWTVQVFDNLSRIGTESNLAMLKEQGITDFIRGDIRDFDSLYNAIEAFRPAIILHLAGQVAVTTSVINPREDFDINALGTLNVLEAIRKTGTKPLVIYSSTNKVYGGMEEVSISNKDSRYVYDELPYGVSEKMQLDFHSPYGCSKGAADQYVRDYFRIYDIPGVVLRQSCIYGPNQFGIEDQGWVAWFTIATTFGRNITIYGDGMQIRDVLHISDLVRLYELCATQPEFCKGKIYNVGGGPEFTMNLLELVELLEKNSGKKITPQFAGWRPGDQRVYVSDIRKVKADLGWYPEVTPEKGVRTLAEWVTINRESISKVLNG